jgi:hypothetical protein
MAESEVVEAGLVPEVQHDRFGRGPGRSHEAGQ